MKAFLANDTPSIYWPVSLPFSYLEIEQMKTDGLSEQVELVKQDDIGSE